MTDLRVLALCPACRTRVLFKKKFRGEDEPQKYTMQGLCIFCQSQLDCDVIVSAQASFSNPPAGARPE